MPKLKATATAGTRDEAIRLAKRELVEKARRKKKRLTSEPKVEKTWVQGLFGYGAKVSAEVADIGPRSTRRSLWRRK